MDSYRNRGPQYREVLVWLHRFIRPRTYLEIGVHTGATFALAECPSIAVDPHYGPLQSSCIGKKRVALFYQMTSDQFFREYDPTRLLGAPVDLGFLDGMHLFEWLLRDFYNTERACHPRSVIALHDCIPPDRHFIRRNPQDQTLRDTSAYPDGHGGDVWKIVPLLRKYRPDLRVHCFDADPTGLVLVTNLDPSSGLLQDRYFDLIEEASDTQLPGGTIGGLIETLNVLPANLLSIAHEASRFVAPAN